MEVTINIPEDVAKVFLADGGDIEREILEATALEGYREGKLSRAQVGRMLDLNRFETEDFLKAHHALLHYSMEDLEQDRRVIDALLSK